MMGGGGQQLQQISQQLQAIDAEIEELEGDVDDLQAETDEIDDAIEAIETLESGSMVQVPLGGDAYVQADIQDIDEVIVSLGGGYAAEQDQDSAISALQHKQETVVERIGAVEAEIEELEDESSDLEKQAQAMQQRMQQQQQQMAQMGQPGQEDE